MHSVWGPPAASRFKSWLASDGGGDMARCGELWRDMGRYGGDNSHQLSPTGGGGGGGGQGRGHTNGVHTNNDLVVVAKPSPPTGWGAAAAARHANREPHRQDLAPAQRGRRTRRRPRRGRRQRRGRMRGAAATQTRPSPPCKAGGARRGSRRFSAASRPHLGKVSTDRPHLGRISADLGRSRRISAPAGWGARRGARAACQQTSERRPDQAESS